jgi:hypothetical protein
MQPTQEHFLRHTNVTKLTLSAPGRACYFCGAMETLESEIELLNFNPFQSSDTPLAETPELTGTAL